MHSLSKKEVLNSFNSSIETGLSFKNIEKIRQKYGFNKLTTKKGDSLIIVFLKQLASPLIFVLIIASVVSFLFHEYIDAGVILFTVFLNSVIGFFQEYKAEKTMESLKNMIVFECVVVRNRKKIQIKTEELVPGDIVLLEQGSSVPADCRILESKELMVNESILTGESLPINKTDRKIHKDTVLAERTNMLYMGTAIVSGRATAIVVKIGDKTEIGGINSLTQSKKDKFPLQEKIEKMTIQITVVVVFICFFIMIVGFLLSKDLLEMFLLSVSIAVSTIPEGLAIGVTVILALGVKYILKNNALVRNLYSAQTLGSTTVICTDKTGTITEGKMYIDSLITFNDNIFIKNNNINYSKKFSNSIKKLIEIGVNCNNSIIEEGYDDDDGIDGILGTPTENAILYFAYKNSYFNLSPKIDEIPFNSERKFMLTLNSINNKNSLFLKGAPERIFEKCEFVLDNNKIKKITEKDLNKIKLSYDKLASSGLRIIACAYKDFGDNYLKIKKTDTEYGFVFVGFFAIKDPLRKDSRHVINTCRKAGIKICMLTGDNKMIAESIGKEIGLLKSKDIVIDGFELDLLSDEDLNKKIKNISIFARVTPAHKLRIINALKNSGEIVAMNGDGVNDAPALKLADIGIALGSGTDIAKESSDIVLIDDNLSSIVKSIEQGRVIFFNIRKLSFFLLSDCFSGVVLIVGSLMLGLPIPLTASQILIANLIQDGLPAMFLAKEKKDFDFLKSKPVSHDYNILNFELGFLTLISSFIMGLSVLFSFNFASKIYDLETARTLAFSMFSFVSVFYIFSAKNLENNITFKSFVNNKFVTISVLVSILLQLFIVYNPLMNYIFKTKPLRLKELLLVFAVGVCIVVVIEFIKFIFKKIKK